MAARLDQEVIERQAERSGRSGARHAARADLVDRNVRGISQRAAAELLGVASSTVAKAELLPMEPLGEALAVALRGRLAS
jgi:hypothetical protein